MELRHLRYFVAVAEELSYRKAAERLRVAQPALSSQIKDLETELGVRLLDRNTAGVRLTDAGVAFLAETRLTLAQAGQAVVAAQDVAQGRRGRLEVGYSGPLLMGFMPESLKVFSKKFPDHEVALIELPVDEQIAGLEAGTIQVGFTIGGSIPIPAWLEQREILRSSIRLVVGHGHRLATTQSVALADLVHDRLLCLSDRTGSALHHAIMQRLFTARSLKPDLFKTIDGAEAFRAALECGFGVSLIPEIGSLSRSPDLIFKSLTDTGEDLFLNLRVLWSGRTSSILVDNFLSVLPQLKVAPMGSEPKKRGRKKGPGGTGRAEHLNV